MSEQPNATPDPLGGWPQFDPKMMREFGGRWVAVIGREYLGDAATPELAMTTGRTEAARRGLDQAGLHVVAVCRPEDAWL